MMQQDRESQQSQRNWKEKEGKQEKLDTGKQAFFTPSHESPFHHHFPSLLPHLTTRLHRLFPIHVELALSLNQYHSSSSRLATTLLLKQPNSHLEPMACTLQVLLELTGSPGEERGILGALIQLMPLRGSC